jgi:hypothetical protein
MTELTITGAPDAHRPRRDSRARPGAARRDPDPCKSAHRLVGRDPLASYLGGAVAAHARIGGPLFSHTLSGVYPGLLVRGGLWLRDPKPRARLPRR